MLDQGNRAHDQENEKTEEEKNVDEDDFSSGFAVVVFSDTAVNKGMHLSPAIRRAAKMAVEWNYFLDGEPEKRHPRQDGGE